MSAIAAATPKTTQPPSPHVSGVSLLARARSLRGRARHVNPVLADAYLRRAAELTLEAWARAACSTPVETGDLTATAA